MEKIFVTIIITTLLNGYWLVAQQPANKDSVLLALKTAKEDSNKVKLLLQSGELYKYNDAKTADKYYLQAFELSKKINYNNGLFNSYSARADLLSTQGHTDSSLNLQLQMLEWSKKINDSLKIGTSLYIVGYKYMMMRQSENALHYLELSRSVLAPLDKSGKFEALTYYYLGLINSELHQYRKAVDYSAKAVEKYASINNQEMLGAATLSHGYNYIGLKQYDSAKYYFEKSLSLGKQINSADVEILSNLNIGYIYLLQRDFDRMKPYAEEGIYLSDKYGIPDNKGRAFWGMATYYLSKKQYQTSKQYADSALAIAVSSRDNEQRLRLLLHQSNLAFAMQEPKQGYDYLSAYEGLRDSSINDNLQRLTTDYEKKYETEKKDRQIKEQQTTLKDRRRLNYLFAGIALALFVIVVLIYRNLKNRQKLQQVKIEELETEKQLSATEAVLKGEEQERTRLAKDLHDGLGGMLSGIKYSLSNMKENLIMTTDNAQAFERSIDMLDSSIREMRRVAHNMMPEMLLKYGLDIALKEFCAEIDRSAVLHTTYQSIGMTEATIEQSTAVTIYRVVQELVNNAIKHARAKNVLVQAHFAAPEKLLTVTIEDDGKGFDTVLLRNAPGIGWSNIKNRLEFLHGRFDINSAPGKGTSVLIEINI